MIFNALYTYKAAIKKSTNVIYFLLFIMFHAKMSKITFSSLLSFPFPLLLEEFDMESLHFDGLMLNYYLLPLLEMNTIKKNLLCHYKIYS